MSCKRLYFFALLLLFGVVESIACKPQVNWSSSVSFCYGNSFTLSAYNPNSTYLWSTQDTTGSIVITTSGTYYVTVTNACGSTSDTLQVIVDYPLVVNLGNDRSMCSANNPVLSAPYSPTATYLWQDNSTSRQIPVTHSGMYYVKVTNLCGSVYDTVNITLDVPLNVNLGPDINDCTSGSNVIGFAPGQKGKIFWKTGDTTNAITVTNPGTYWVRMTNSCGIFRDTIVVTHDQGSSLDIGDTIRKCASSLVTLSSNIKGGSFLWSNSANTQSIQVSNAGMYWLKYTDNCGIYYDTVYVINRPPIALDLGVDTGVCHNTNFHLNAYHQGSNYLWSTGDTSSTIPVLTTGAYWVRVSDGCSVHFDTINVDVWATPIDSIPAIIYYCAGSPVIANAGSWGPSTTYLWDDLSTGQTNSYASAGVHHVYIYSPCDTLRVDFTVQELVWTGFDLGPDTILCGPMIVDTKLPKSQHKFLWSLGGTEPFRLIDQPGKYWVQVTNPCGVFYDTIEVIVVTPPAITSPRKVELCQGANTLITAVPNNNMTKFLWSTGDTTHNIRVSNPGVYTLQASNICDTIYDSVKVNVVSPINFSLGNDTILCTPQTLVMNVTGHIADSIKWSTGSRNGIIPITTSGTYWLNMYNGCGVFSDTIKVTIKDKPKKDQHNASYCIGTGVVLDAQKPNVLSYQWSNGAVTSSISVNTPGWYWVNLSNECGVTRDSFYVRQDNPIQQFDLGNDTIFCAGTMWLDPGNIAGATYKWQDGTSSRRYFVTKSGTYKVVATNSCNSVSDSITVLITGPPKLVLGDSVKFCHGSTFTFNAQNPGSTYLWNDSSTSQYLATTNPGKYWVTITNPCGTLTDTVKLITEYPILDLDLGNDTIICKGQSLILNGDYHGAFVWWSTGATTKTLEVTQTGEYFVNLSNSCGVWLDTIYVEVQDVPVFSLGPDSLVCNLDIDYELSGPVGLDHYLWSNGDTNRVTRVPLTGTHWLEVTNKCFSYTDSIVLIGEDPIPLDLGPDTVLCFGESLILNPGNYAYPTYWYNGHTASTKEITRSGSYWALATNSCGTYTDTIQVTFDYPLDPGTTETVVCKGDSAVVDLENETIEILWFDGSTDKLRSFGKEGSYSAKITNTCGTFDKIFEVDLSNCDCPLYMANAFTPNGDGINDEFASVYDCDITSYKLVVFNRWGSQVYETTDPTDVWDGTQNGKPLPIGTYNYKVYYSWMVYEVEHSSMQRGVINLLK